MKFNEANIIYRAVFEGVLHGMQEVKRQQEATTDITPETMLSLLSDSVMGKLSEVLVIENPETNIE